MNIPNITLDNYVENVQWHLQVLTRATCQHVIWLTNTYPLAKQYRQTPESILQWNTAVRDRVLLASDNGGLGHMSSYVDVYQASANAKHNDNIHMDSRWYRTLGDMFVNLINYGNTW